MNTTTNADMCGCDGAYDDGCHICTPERHVATGAGLEHKPRDADRADREINRLKQEMRHVIIQADCLRHYARMDRRKGDFPGLTVGEIQAGHFEDIAVRCFPELQGLLDEKRAGRAALAGKDATHGRD